MVVSQVAAGLFGADKADFRSVSDEGSLALHLNDAAAVMANDAVAAAVLS